MILSVILLLVWSMTGLGSTAVQLAVQLCVWWVFVWGQAGGSAWRCLYRVLCVVSGWVGAREAGGIGLEHLLQCTAA